MSVFDLIFKNRPKEPDPRYEGYFKMLNGYTPRFTSFAGEIYEMEQIRSSINIRATHMSKLKVGIVGAAKPRLQRKLKNGPNQLQTWSQFLYRLSTLLDVHNTAFITPIFDEYGEPSGIFTPLPTRCEIVQFQGKPWIRYEFADHTHAAVELENCGIMTKFQYKSDFMGETNKALYPVIDLIDIQDQGIKEGVKSAASYRFMAQIDNFTKDTDLTKERRRFTEENFSRDAKAGGLLLFPYNYKDIKQLDIKPWVVDAEQMKLINDNVFNHFGVNEAILQNRASPDELDCFFNGAIEPFMIQLSEVMTKMLFTFHERSIGNEVIANANRLQYMSVSQKVAMAQQLGDRGALMIDEIRELFNLPPLPDGNGQHAPIRGEYYYAGEDQDDAEKTGEE